MKKKGKILAKVKKITFTKSQMECEITLADSQADSPSTQPQSRDAQKPPIMKKTCRKRKVDSDDGDGPATKKQKSLNQTSLKSNIKGGLVKVGPRVAA
ncbi:hypothetical protein E2562_030658 [Oryza meyeriana var. granulata]|uniref:Uncharacterized protein n=1 Tax=Oryza meyeriana var. granulata TaxID=110450 RepID=A0A6G1DQB3_9ORYZ|nr:hypothetical protein E2562_030658 [Oryza meyeriana var. granulata]